MFEDTDLLVELRCFRTGATVRRRDDNGAISEYPVDPEDITEALLKNKEKKPVIFTTGLTSPALLYYSQQGAVRVVAEYRPPQVTGIWLDGSDTPIKTPLPGLVLVAHIVGKQVVYKMVAVKSRPEQFDDIVYNVPLPNIQFGDICWGSTKLPIIPETSIDLNGVWTAFFSTPFGNHTVSEKSHKDKYKSDIRALLIDLDRRHARTYPLTDLVQNGKLRAFI